MAGVEGLGVLGVGAEVDGQDSWIHSAGSDEAGAVYCPGIPSTIRGGLPELTISYMFLPVHGSLDSGSTAILLAARTGEDCHVAVGTPHCGCASGHCHRRVPIDPDGLSERPATLRI